MTMTEVRPLDALPVGALEYCPGAPFPVTMRQLDIITGGAVFVADGYVSDRYRALPAKSVSWGPAKDHHTADDLAPGVYATRNATATPEAVNGYSLPSVASVVRQALEAWPTATRVPASPRELHGRRVVLAATKGDDTYIFDTADGREVALSRPMLDEMTGDASFDHGDAHAGETRYRVLVAPPECKSSTLQPVVVELTRYSTARYVDGTATATVIGRSEALLMPVRL